ncbi:Spc98 family-domain-containing protein [Xylariaceae sp. FL1272]|nr:Spc98 family-domain-containing protein [Xylariaceae sp. FL1272]
MAYAAILNDLTAELVEAIASTTAPSDPEHLDVMRESSLRRLRNHSFLRTNHFDVYNALDGYEEHFRVLNRDGLADALRNSLDGLAKCSSNWTPDALHLLLQLADQPIQKSSLRDLQSLKEPDEEPGPTLHWDDIAKEEGWEEEPDVWRDVDFGGNSSDDDYHDDGSDASQSEHTSPSSNESQHLKRPADYLDTSKDEEILDKVWLSQVWRQKTDTTSLKAPVTEIQVVRDLLFMLSGYDTNLFDEQGKPSLDIQLHHASWQIFRTFLYSAGEARREISLLRRYTQQTPKIPLLQVFQEAIEERLISFDKVLSDLHAPFVNISRDVVASMMKTMNDLEPHIHPLRCLSKLVERLEAARHPHPFHYLELLYDSANELQAEGDEAAYKFIGELFFQCFEIYLRPIRLWMENGEVTDDDRIFVSSSPLKLPRTQVWTEQFNLKRIGKQGTLYAPRFLQPAASKIFTAGKSIVILKLLGKHSPTEKEPEPAARVDLHAVSDFVPFSEIFRNMFDQWMQSKQSAASITLRRTLFHDCSLWSDIDVLHQLYLMCNGARSDHLTNAVFNNIDILDHNWHNRFTLTEITREAFDGRVEPHRLTVSVMPSGASINVNDVRKSVRQGLPLLRLTYLLPWPARIVVSDESLDHYQSIFTFLLQLRRATYVLTRQRIVSNSSAHESADEGMFFKLRAKLLWFCNVLQSYLSTLVLEPLVASFEEGMKRTIDVDQMITEHSKCTKRMLDESCLGSRLQPIRQVILDVFDLAIQLIDARRVESERQENETQELSRLSVMAPPQKPSIGRFIEASEEEDETFLAEQDQSVMMQDTGETFRGLLNETSMDLDRHLKFICGGLRGVARASGSVAATKWDTLAEMLEVGVGVHGYL